jgi:dTDP-4-dehydrorhamnose reductase
MATTPHRLLVTGAAGYLGRELAAQAAVAGLEVAGTWHDRPAAGVRLDIRDAAAVRRAVAAAAPDAVVHTAYLQSGDAMRAVNVEGSANVAAASAAAGARLVHLSTDFVFDGEQAAPYRECDRPAPVTDYGQAKLDAERAVASAQPDALIVRTSLIYGGAQLGPHERLVLDALDGRSDVGFFTDELRSPVAVRDLASALLELAAMVVAGPLHVAGPQPVSRHEFARLLAAALGRDPAGLRAARSAGLPQRRPLDCVLDSSRAQSMLATRLRPVSEVLAGAASPGAPL